MQTGGLKTTGSVHQKVNGREASDTALLTVSRRLQSESKHDDAAQDATRLSERQRHVLDEKRLWAVMTGELETPVTVDEDPISGSGLDKVLDRHLSLCGARPGGNYESGAGAGTWTSINDCLKEVE